MADGLDMRRLLAPIGAERFFAEHWQSRMALLPLAADDLAFVRQAIGPLDPARLAGLAREGAQAWLANEFVAHSVFPADPANAAKFHDAGATLYFINVPLPALTDGVADFLGAPRRQVIASLFFTPAGGGAVRVHSGRRADGEATRRPTWRAPPPARSCGSRARSTGSSPATTGRCGSAGSSPRTSPARWPAGSC